MAVPLTLEQKRKKNREAQKKFYNTQKGKKYALDKYKKWAKKKRTEDPNYFKKYQKNRTEYFKKYQAKRRKENPEKVKQLNREAQRKYSRTEKGKKHNLEKTKKWIKKKRATDPNWFKKYYGKYSSKYNKDRSEYFQKYRANLFLKDPEKLRIINRQGAKKFYEKTKKTPKYILIRALRGRLGFIFSSIKNQQKPSTKRLLGCSLEELIVFIEKKFKKDMSWDNYGKWHVDHIRPISKFDLTDKEEQKKCFHYTNLQPLWAVDNLKKGSKIIS